MASRNAGVRQTEKTKKHFRRTVPLLAVIFGGILCLATASCLSLAWSALYTTPTHEHVILGLSITQRSPPGRNWEQRSTPSQGDDMEMYVPDGSDALLFLSQVQQQNAAFDSAVQRQVATAQQPPQFIPQKSTMLMCPIQMSYGHSQALDHIGRKRHVPAIVMAGIQ